MALNLADRIAVRRVIVDRCTGQVVQFANYILGGGEVAGVTEESALGWAREAIRAPASHGDTISWYVINQQDFLDNGSGVTDQFLQGVVEAAIKTHFMVASP